MLTQCMLPWSFACSATAATATDGLARDLPLHRHGSVHPWSLFPRAHRGRLQENKSDVRSLYLYRDPKTNELVWVIGYTLHDKPEDVNDPRYSASKDIPFGFFDSSASTKGGCALNGPAAPECKWRECGAINGDCYAYPKSTGSQATWYNRSATLKVVVDGKGGHCLRIGLDLAPSRAAA